MNAIFTALVTVAFATAAWQQLAGNGELMGQLGRAMLDDAGSAVTLALGLVGAMALFLGALKVGEAAGLLTAVARLLRPLLVRLFPDVPKQHPAMGAMVMNIAANLLGLGNAATPFGIRAMQQLDALNPVKGTASNAMVLFLAINTASVTLLPTSVIALRAAAGSTNPAGIVPTTLLATIISTGVAIGLARALGRWWPVSSGVDEPATPMPVPPPGSGDTDWPLADVAAPEASATPGAPEAPARRKAPEAPERCKTPEAPSPGSVEVEDAPLRARTIALAVGLATVVLLIAVSSRPAAAWIVPSLVTGMLVAGALRGVAVYERFVEGARDAFAIAVRIIPYLVAILMAVGMLRASGALDAVITPLASLTAPLGLPAEALLMTVLRTLSGSGAYAYLATVLSDPAIGPDSYTGYLVSTIQASTETTFYVLAVYFGSVGVRRMRHAVIAGLGADAAGAAGSVLACQLLQPG